MTKDSKKPQRFLHESHFLDWFNADFELFKSAVGCM